MVIGQRTKEVPTISGMQSAGAQHRLVLVFSSLVLVISLRILSKPQP